VLPISELASEWVETGEEVSERREGGSKDVRPVVKVMTFPSVILEGSGVWRESTRVRPLEPDVVDADDGRTLLKEPGVIEI
jgi:hypothetical protein